MKNPALNIFLILLSVATGFGMFSGSLVMFLDFTSSAILAIFRFAYPFLLLLMMVLLLIWVLKKSKWWLFCLLCIGLSLNQLFTIIPPRLKAEFNPLKSETTLRVLSWNVSRWDERNKVERGGVSFRPLMMDYIESTGADVLCLQEFFECNDPALFAANIPELKKRGYPYYAFQPSSQLFNGKLQYGVAIFSKFPIIQTEYFENSKGEHSEGLLYADIEVAGSKIRVFNTHLETPGISKTDYSEEGKMKVSRSVLSKIKNSYQLRNIQAQRAADEIKKSPHPVIIAADLGDVPNSFSYKKLRSNLGDAFLEKGYGLGATLRHTSPTLRIDFLFFDPSLSILQFDNINTIRYSDHLPLLADFHHPVKK